MNNLKLLNSAKHQAQPNILLDRLKAVWPIQFNEDDPKHHNDYQEPKEPQEDQGHPPSMGRFLMDIFHITPQVLYIFGNLGPNPVE